METIEDLVVGVEGGSHIRVGETLVESEVDGREKAKLRARPPSACANSPRMSRKRSCCFSLSAST